MDCDRLRSAGKEKSARRGDCGRECLAEVADIDRSMDARRSSERPRSIEARKGWSPSDRKDGGGIETSSGCHPVAGIRVVSGARMLAAAGWYGSDMMCVPCPCHHWHCPVAPGLQAVTDWCEKVLRLPVLQVTCWGLPPQPVGPVDHPG